jgi:tripartite-type tricarboxylate transporter receptor subunit TctC
VRSDDSRFKSISDFINYAKKNPKLITAALPGVFGDDHLYLMEFLDATGIEISQVPFKGSGLSRTALLGGHVDCLLENTLTFFGFVGPGKPLKVLVHFWPEKKLVEEGVIFAEAFPEKVANYPLLNESGSYRGFFAPKGVPSDRLEILRETFKKAMNDPGFLADAKKRGVPVGYLSGPDWEDKIKQFQPVTDKMAKKYGKYVGGHNKK